MQRQVADLQQRLQRLEARVGRPAEIQYVDAAILQPLPVPRVISPTPTPTIPIPAPVPQPVDDRTEINGVKFRFRLLSTPTILQVVPPAVRPASQPSLEGVPQR